VASRLTALLIRRFLLLMALVAGILAALGQ
jgi:hypothetical protein